MSFSFRISETDNNIVFGDVFVNLGSVSFAGQSHSFQVELLGDTHYYIADTLTENVKYTFRVKAMTRINWGPAVEGNITTGPQAGSKLMFSCISAARRGSVWDHDAARPA